MGDQACISRVTDVKMDALRTPIVQKQVADGLHICYTLGIN